MFFVCRKYGEEDANGVSTIEKAEAEVYSVEPRYKECDMKTGNITDWKINYDLKGKLIRSQCISENYIYGFISEFSDTNREDDEELIAIKR